MTEEIRDQLIAILARHPGGWLDNGNTDKCRCPCGYRPTIGEFHGSHVADDILSSLPGAFS